jgi:hypothetical protein
MVAESDDLCVRITMTLDCKTQTVLWVEAPIHQTEIYAKTQATLYTKQTYVRYQG